MRIINGGRAMQRNAPAWRPSQHVSQAPTATLRSKRSDHVSLSRVYGLIRSSHMEPRINSLSLQVRHKTYVIPALFLSRRLLANQTWAA